MNFLRERPVIRDHLFRRLARRQIIITRIKDNFAWLIRKNNSLCEGRGVRNLRPAKPAINPPLARKIPRQRRPLADARTSDKKDCALGRRIRPITRLKRRDLLFPRRCIGLRRQFFSTHSQNQQPDQPTAVIIGANKTSHAIILNSFTQPVQPIPSWELITMRQHLQLVPHPPSPRNTQFLFLIRQF